MSGNEIQGEQLLDDVHTAIQKYCVLSSTSAYTAVTLWCAYTQHEGSASGDMDALSEISIHPYPWLANRKISLRSADSPRYHPLPLLTYGSDSFSA